LQVGDETDQAGQKNQHREERQQKVIAEFGGGAENVVFAHLAPDAARDALDDLQAEFKSFSSPLRAGWRLNLCLIGGADAGTDRLRISPCATSLTAMNESPRHPQQLNCQ